MTTTPCCICGELVEYIGGRRDRLCPTCHNEQTAAYEAKRHPKSYGHYAQFIGVIPGLPQSWRDIVDPFVGGMLEIYYFRASLPDLVFDGLIVEMRGKRLLVDGDKLTEYSGDYIGNVALI